MTAVSATAPRLRLRGIGYDLGARALLEAVDLDLEAGEVVALVGPNGAGKSTLLHVLAGDNIPSRGTIELDGAPLAGMPARRLARRRSVLTQANTVSFPFTVAEVVEMGRAPWEGRDESADDDALIHAALVDAEVEALADRRMPELSGGERARASYARMLAQDCGIVLLDEPTASLDIRHQERLLAQLRRHASRGGSAVIVLHDLNLAAAYADRIVLLESGRIRADGVPAASLDPALLTEVYRHPIDVHRLNSGLLVQPLRHPVLEEGPARV